MARHQSIDTYIDDARGLAENVIANPELQAIFAKAKLDVAHFEAARTRIERLGKLHGQIDDEKGDQVGARIDRDETRGGAHDVYMVHVGTADIVFEGDPATRRALRLDEPRERRLDLWAAQALTFYDNLLGDVDREEKMVDKGITTEALTAARAAVAAVSKADDRHEKESDEVDAVREERDTLLLDTQKWVAVTRKLARMHGGDAPGFREQLGL